MRAGEKNSISSALKPVLVLALLLLWGAVPGYAQISFDAREKHAQQVRQSLKEADVADYAYKDTHLNTNAYTFKRGAAARKRLKKDDRARYQFDENGMPARKFQLFRKKKDRQLKKKN